MRHKKYSCFFACEVLDIGEGAFRLADPGSGPLGEAAGELEGSGDPTDLGHTDPGEFAKGIH